MPAAIKTPGVYIVENNAFPNSVVEVATAIPVFIGYTEKADDKGNSLLGKPWRISSLPEYRSWFGQGPKDLFELDDKGAGVLKTPAFRMYQALRFYFQNGGGPCYIVSVGSYGDEIGIKPFEPVFAELENAQEPTLVVIPEAVSLAAEDCATLQNASLAHCEKMQNRFAILDVHEGWKEPEECIEPFRASIVGRLDLAAAYYPWVRTSLHVAGDVTFENISNQDVLKTILEGTLPKPSETDTDAEKARRAEIDTELAKLGTELVADDAVLLHKQLLVAIPRYGQILESLRGQLNLFPPAAGMAGVYARIDNSRGVWKPPANVGIAGVVEPAVRISAEAQDNLNVPSSGRAVNAIRAFIGEGTLVWGARTMDGNSLHWRYINVRRTMFMLQESVRLATQAYAFEPNAAGTWVIIKAMISNFLMSVWKRGGLAGAVPEDAFLVHVGLGDTMTPEDILEGILRVTVLVALSRPAEFIEITFEQQIQKA